MARIRYSLLRWITVVLLWALLAGPAMAAQRVALVIGNASYAPRTTTRKPPQ